MEKLTERRSVTTIIDALRFLRIRLRSRPESRPLAQDIELAKAALDEANARLEALIDERRALTAELEYLVEVLYEAIIQLAREVRAKLGGQVDTPLFLSIFPIAPSTAMKEGLASKLQYCRQAAGQVIESEALASLKPSGEELLTQVNAIDALLSQRDGELAQSERSASLKQKEALEAARNTYNQTEPKLMLLWPSKPKLVDSMFYDLSRSPEPKEDQA